MAPPAMRPAQLPNTEGLQQCGRCDRLLAAAKLRRQRTLAVETLFPWFEETLNEWQREQLGRDIQAQLSCLLGEDRRD